MIKWIKHCAESVFNEMGSSHSEAVYEACMALELSWRAGPIPITVIRQVPCPLKYKGFTVGVGFIDIVVSDVIYDSTVVELKTVAKLLPKDEQQVRKYLEALDLEKGMLINFGNSLEIIEVYKQTPGILRVPFSISSEEVVALKEALEERHL